MSIKVLKATIGNLVDFYTNARGADLEEVQEATGIPFSYQPLSSLENLQVVVDGVTGEVLGIGGIQDHCIWLLMTYAVEDRKIEFLRFSKRYLRELLNTHVYLYNRVYMKNKLHMDWLNWLGAEWLDTDNKFSTFILKK